jgi:hypothetical protein
VSALGISGRSHDDSVAASKGGLLTVSALGISGRSHEASGTHPASTDRSEISVRVELLVLSIAVAAALAALLDSARRAAHAYESELEGNSFVARGVRGLLEELERKRALLGTERGPRLLGLLASGSATAAIGWGTALARVEVAAVFGSLAGGLALAGWAWWRDRARRCRELSAEIAALKARLDASTGRSAASHAFGVGGIRRTSTAPPRRS